MAAVTLKGIEKQYDNGFKAVHGIDLDIKEGEFMVFVGPSGCAKSTTLRMIAGLESISGGELHIGGRCMNDVPSKDRGIAMVFQDYALYPHMTVYDNMSFGLKVAKLPKNEIDQRVREAAEKLQITDLLDRKPSEMSGGQRQRVAVGRAIVRKPDVFLFDEPLSNLDAKLRVSMRVRITSLHRELKKSGQPATMIYVTHDQVESMTMGDRICVLNQGRIMQVDTPMNLYNYPANKFVAGFIGSPAMNLMKAKLVQEGGDIAVELGKHRFTLPAEKATKVQTHVGKEIWFGSRPEYIGNAETHPECVENSFTEEILTLERMGFEENIYFEVDGQPCSARIPHEKAGESDVGNQYTFCIDMNKCHIFDMETEQNISL
ncbi:MULTISPECIES: ABC transporter ATP-binding protein [Vibrio]|uniref:ABC transporter ATP-binding protein n=1 Tax=Vibrio TaxID=662 RepID=UPI001EFC687D|nr:MULTISPECIES: sn-glycerol-3-phosphate ABC transporter ATP-binding protein UgpC [Vibrio]MCG9677537.1 sn-glycerol-3-phosphate ABC transporter ATP-binding protein UgpC [Vibrio sp. Isolate24]USD35069.1 sn-glycerol-3-phosphate ABC transporter ATP-binding protein UgpC [Vibrio sp. SCSIO 43186]USD48135.1 sn-glycerol-3-phosphate ABC transporter ATP-binding protein UgpC [Vibrio sp. SCSIO 43145]USD72194.1 sn-glycerol-3-phosphate ABC transporter ATP-binding protein UgpC [Vibrio sp. SCSIO 43139]USD97867